mgnify:CR=1 FL=1
MSYKRFDPQDVVISAESVTSTVFSNGVTEQTVFITSSTQVAGASGEYYYNEYQTARNDATAANDARATDDAGTANDATATKNAGAFPLR